MATRLANPPVKPKIVRAILPHEWLRLLNAAIQRAEKMKDPRLAGLRKGLETGQAEQTLRRLGIVCQADLQREFPR